MGSPGGNRYEVLDAYTCLTRHPCRMQLVETKWRYCYIPRQQLDTTAGCPCVLHTRSARQPYPAPQLSRPMIRVIFFALKPWLLVGSAMHGSPLLSQAQSRYRPNSLDWPAGQAQYVSRLCTAGEKMKLVGDCSSRVDDAVSPELVIRSRPCDAFHGLIWYSTPTHEQQSISTWLKF